MSNNQNMENNIDNQEVEILKEQYIQIINNMDLLVEQLKNYEEDRNKILKILYTKYNIEDDDLEADLNESDNIDIINIGSENLDKVNNTEIIELASENCNEDNVNSELFNQTTSNKKTKSVKEKVTKTSKDKAPKEKKVTKEKTVKKTVSKKN